MVMTKLCSLVVDITGRYTKIFKISTTKLHNFIMTINRPTLKDEIENQAPSDAVIPNICRNGCIG